MKESAFDLTDTQQSLPFFKYGFTITQIRHPVLTRDVQVIANSGKKTANSELKGHHFDLFPIHSAYLPDKIRDRIEQRF